MAILSNLIVRIQGNSASLTKSLDQSQSRIGKFRSGAVKAFKAVSLAAVGVGAAFATNFARGVQGLIEFEAELRPAVERSRIGAESLQLLAEAAKRAGSEDGLEAIVDTSQELQLQLGEIALTGNARAVPALEKLGLTAQQLQDMKPEEAWKLVVAEIQKIPNVADRAILAEEVFGGTSEKLAGIVNLTNEEFAALNAEVAKTSDIWSGDTLEAAKQFDQEIQNLKTDLQRGTNALIAGMLPALVSIAQWIRSDGLPVWQEFKAAALEPFVNLIHGTLIPAIMALPATLDSWGRALNDVDTGIAPVDYALWAIASLLQGNFTVAVRLARIALDELVGAVQPLVDLVSGAFRGAFALLTMLLRSSVFPVLQEMWAIFATLIWPMLRDLVIPLWVDFVTKRLTLLKFVYETAVGPVLDTLTKVLMIWLPRAIRWLSSTFSFNTKKMGDDATGFETDFLGPFQTIIDFINDDVIPAWDELVAKVMPQLEETWNEHLKPTFDELDTLITDTIIPLIEENQHVWEAAWQAIQDITVSVLDFAIETIENSIGVITGLIRGFSAVLRGDWDAAWQAVLDVTEEFQEQIENVIDLFLDVLNAIFKQFGTDVDTVWTNIWEGLKSTFETISAPIKSGIQSLLNLADRVTSAIRNIPKISVPQISLPSIPGAAEGGTIRRGGTTLVGERGPELLRLPRGAQVIPLQGGAGGGAIVNMNFYGLTPDQLPRTVRREIRQLKVEGVLP